MTLSTVTFNNNYGFEGGILYATSTLNLAFTDSCYFSSNQAYQTGGLLSLNSPSPFTQNYYSTLTISNSTIENTYTGYQSLGPCYGGLFIFNHLGLKSVDIIDTDIENSTCSCSSQGTGGVIYVEAMVKPTTNLSPTIRISANDKSQV